jgi:hypothetical protein
MWGGGGGGVQQKYGSSSSFQTNHMMACLEGLNLERSLVVGDCLGQLVAVQVEVDVDDVGEQPLGLPPVLLWVLHLRTVLGTVQLRE